MNMNRNLVIVGTACAIVVCAIGMLIGYRSAVSVKNKINVVAAADTATARTYKSGLLLDTSRMMGFYADCYVKDTLWTARVNYKNGKPTDTVLFNPSKLAKDGPDALEFLGEEKDLLAYAERKHIMKFCYQKPTGLQIYIHLKKNQNYWLASPRHGIIGKAIHDQHKEGWSALGADRAFWLGDTLVYGESIAVAMNADAIIDCPKPDDGLFHFEDTPLKKVLAEFASYQHFEISNPENLIGLNVTGVMRKAEPAKILCDMLTRIESGDVFIKYDKGVVRISKKK